MCLKKSCYKCIKLLKRAHAVPLVTFCMRFPRATKQMYTLGFGYVAQSRYVLSEHEQNTKMNGMCQYIRAVRLVLEWQQPNIPAAVLNNQTTKDKENKCTAHDWICVYGLFSVLFLYLIIKNCEISLVSKFWYHSIFISSQIYLII